MPGEYSRELSVKVFAGQCRLVELGYMTEATCIECVNMAGSYWVSVSKMAWRFILFLAKRCSGNALMPSKPGDNPARA